MGPEPPWYTEMFFKNIFLKPSKENRKNKKNGLLRPSMSILLLLELNCVIFVDSNSHNLFYIIFYIIFTYNMYILVLNLMVKKLSFYDLRFARYWDSNFGYAIGTLKIYRVITPSLFIVFGHVIYHCKRN